MASHRQGDGLWRVRIVSRYRFNEGFVRLIANAGAVHVAPGVLSPNNMAGGIMLGIYWRAIGAGRRPIWHYCIGWRAITRRVMAVGKQRPTNQSARDTRNETAAEIIACFGLGGGGER